MLASFTTPTPKLTAQTHRAGRGPSRCRCRASRLAHLSRRLTSTDRAPRSCPPHPLPRSPSAPLSRRHSRRYAGRRRGFRFGHLLRTVFRRSGRFIGASCVPRLARMSVGFALLSLLSSRSDRGDRLDGGFEACSSEITISQVPLRQERRLPPDIG